MRVLTFVVMAGILSCRVVVASLASTFLGRQRSAAAAGAQLRVRARELAEVLGRELSPQSSIQQLAAAARERLDREADHLQRTDARRAALLRKYAHTVPPAVLVVPVYVLPTSLARGSPSNDTSLLEDRDEPIAQSVFKKTEIHNDDKGHLVAHVTTCNNGNCTERTERVEGAAPAAVLGETVDAADSSNADKQAMEFSANRKAKDDLVSSRVQRLVDDMQNFEDAFSARGFDDIFGGAWPRYSDDVFKLPEMEDWPAMESDGDSVSSNTVVKNGKMVSVTKRCHNGQCVTSKKESEIGKGTKPQTSEREMASSRGDNPHDIVDASNPF